MEKITQYLKNLQHQQIEQQIQKQSEQSEYKVSERLSPIVTIEAE